MSDTGCDKLAEDGTCEDTGETCDLCDETIDSMGDTVQVRVTAELYNAMNWSIARLGAYPTQTLVRGVLGGVFIGIGCLMSMLVKSDAMVSGVVSNVMSGLLFSVGLFLTFTCSGELFTGDCLTHVGYEIGVFKLGDCVALISAALLGNFVGALLCAMYAYFANVGLGDVAVAIVDAKNAAGVWELAFRGLMCNLLVCAGTWIAANSDTVAGKLIAAMVPVTTFVALGFEHGVADMFYVFYAGMCGGDLMGMVGGSIAMLSIVSIGNIVGGAWVLSPHLANANN